MKLSVISTLFHIPSQKKKQISKVHFYKIYKTNTYIWKTTQSWKECN